MINNTKFKYAIPVGDNCEIASHLVRNGYTYSSLFRYTRTELDLICNIIESDFEDIFVNIEIFNKTFVKDKKYKIMWHSEIPSGDFEELYQKELTKGKRP